MLTRSPLSYALCMLLGAVPLAQTGKTAPAAAFAGTWFASSAMTTISEDSFTAGGRTPLILLERQQDTYLANSS